MLYLGWIVAAFLFGVFLAAGVALFLARRRTLRDQFDSLGMTDGKDYAEIICNVKTPPWMVEARADGKTLRTWRKGDYPISLLFDRQDYCLGVMEEHTDARRTWT